jgi:hypothetical protein
MAPLQQCRCGQLIDQAFQPILGDSVERLRILFSRHNVQQHLSQAVADRKATVPLRGTFVELVDEALGAGHGVRHRRRSL